MLFASNSVFAWLQDFVMDPSGNIIEITYKSCAKAPMDQNPTKICHFSVAMIVKIFLQCSCQQWRSLHRNYSFRTIV